MTMPALKPNTSSLSSVTETVPYLRPVENKSLPAIPPPDFEEYVEYGWDNGSSIFWIWLKSTAPAKFTPPMIAGIREFQRWTKARYDDFLLDRAHIFQVLASDIPATFHLGGDIAFFQEKIREHDSEGLREYAHSCVDLIYANMTGYSMPITTISLIQGTALGGGFEAALSSDVVIAERGSKMGLPEVLFNMFPGMGAYQFLCRRIAPAQAEKLILSGRTYGADEMYEMGVIDVLAEKGKGEDAVHRYVRKHGRHSKASMGLRKAVASVSPISYEELIRVADIWVDTAMALDEGDLQRMQYLVQAQKNLGF